MQIHTTRLTSLDQVTPLPKIRHESLQLSSSSDHCFARVAETTTTVVKQLTRSSATATMARPPNTLQNDVVPARHGQRPRSLENTTFGDAMLPDNFRKKGKK